MNYEMMKMAVKALDEKKAVNLKVFEIGHLSTLADYLVICNGTSSTQIKALADECEFKLDQAGYQIDHREGMEARSWILLDYIDIIVHIYSTDSRKYYDLERFWKDGIELNIDDILKESDK